MRDSLVASNPCQRPTLHPSLANARWRGITLSFHTMRRGGGTPPCRICLSSLDTTKRGDPLCCVYGFYSMRRGGKPSPSRLFDFIRRDEEGKPSPSCLFYVQCDKAPNTKVCPFGCTLGVRTSCPLHLTGHVKRAQVGTFYMSGVVSNTEHQKHTRLGVFLCSAPSPSLAALPPLPRSTCETEGSFLIN